MDLVISTPSEVSYICTNLALQKISPAPTAPTPSSFHLLLFPDNLFKPIPNAFPESQVCLLLLTQFPFLRQSFTLLTPAVPQSS